MTLVTSDAILLRSYEYSESSRIFRLLTPELGIVSVLARGVKRGGAKGEAPMQSFGEGSVTFVHRPERDLHTLKEMRVRNGSLALGRGILRLSGAALVAELLLVHNLQEGDADLYDWIRSVFRHLADVSEPEVPGWILAGAWKTLAYLGLPPMISHCVICDRPLTSTSDSERIVRFDVSQGGAVCWDCATRETLPRIGPQARRDLGHLVEGIPPIPLRGILPHLSLLEGFAAHHLGIGTGFKTFPTVRSGLNKTTD